MKTNNESTDYGTTDHGTTGKTKAEMLRGEILKSKGVTEANTVNEGQVKGNGETQSCEQWWAGLPPAERQFACELGKMVLGLKEIKFDREPESADKVREKLRLLLHTLACAYDNADVELSSGGLERWRWN